MTPPRGVHCTENSSVKGPVTPNLCIPRDHCRALSCLTSHSLRTALGRAARALTTGVSGSRARPVPCCPPSQGKRAPVTHVVPLLRTAARSPAAGGAVQRGWRPRQKEGGARGAGGVPSGEDPFPQGKADTSRVRTRKAQAVLVGLVWRCGLLAQAMPLGACGFLFNKSKVIAPLSPLWSQPLVSRAVQAAPRAHTPQAGASSQLSPPAASRPLQLHGSWKPWLRYRLCSPCDGLGVAAGAPSWSWMSIRFPAVPRHHPPPSPPNCPCRSEADSSRGPLPS